MEEKKFYPEDLKDFIFSYKIVKKHFPNGVAISELNPKNLRELHLIQVLTKLSNEE